MQWINLELLLHSLQKSVPPFMLFSNLFVMCWANQCCHRHECPIIFKLLCPIFLHAASTCVTLNLYQLALNSGGGSILCLLGPNHMTKLFLRYQFSMSLLLHINFHHEKHLTDCLLLHHLLNVAHTTCAAMYQKKCMISTKLQAKEPGLVNLSHTVTQ
jgi:hypothetical protein